MKKLFLAIFALTLLFAPSVVQVHAQETDVCSCYCKSAGGATKLDDAQDADACQKSCQSEGYRPLGCFGEGQEAFKPENSTLCWTNEECLAFYQAEEYTPLSSSVVTQDPSCPASMGRCYAPPANYELSVALGTVEVVDGLPAYVNAVYSVAIYAASLLVIVVIMAAGVQWMMARGDAGKVSAARGRIQKGLFGLAALLSVVAITEFLDPRLVEFGALKTPLVKPVAFLADGTDCATLPDDTLVEYKGKEVDLGSISGAKCGETAKLVKAGEGSRLVSSGEGECVFKGCAGGKSCVRNPSDAGAYACHSCEDFFSGAVSGITPTEKVCNDISRKISEDDQVICRLIGEGWFDGRTQACYAISAENSGDRLRCSQVRARAAQLKDAARKAALTAAVRSGTGQVNIEYDPCGVYEDLYANSGANWFTNGTVSDLKVDGQFPLLEEVCGGDPCGISPSGCEVSITRQFSSSTSGGRRTELAPIVQCLSK
jgi:hypothetical protein